MKLEELGIHIMTSVFNGILGYALVVYGFLLTFSRTWEGWGFILGGAWLLFTSKIIWELTDYLEKND